MGTVQIQRRIDRLHRTFQPPTGNAFTLEELCRIYWHRYKAQFKAHAAEWGISHFIPQFEYEDKERAANRGRQ